jgi:hypothetical protein
MSPDRHARSLLPLCNSLSTDSRPPSLILSPAAGAIWKGCFIEAYFAAYFKGCLKHKYNSDRQLSIVITRYTEMLRRAGSPRSGNLATLDSGGWGGIISPKASSANFAAPEGPRWRAWQSNCVLIPRRRFATISLRSILAEGVGLSRRRRALRVWLRSRDRADARGSRTTFSSHGVVATISLRSILAEGVGFEPTVTSLPRSISSRVPSTGLSHPSLFSGSASAGFGPLWPVYLGARSVPSPKRTAPRFTQFKCEGKIVDPDGLF